MEYYFHWRIEYHNRLAEFTKNNLGQEKDLSHLCSPLITMDENSWIMCLQPIYNIWGCSWLVAKDNSVDQKVFGYISVQKPWKLWRRHIKRWEFWSAGKPCKEYTDPTIMKKMSWVSKLQKNWIQDSSCLVGIKFGRCGNHFFHIEWAKSLINDDWLECPMWRTKYTIK